MPNTINCDGVVKSYLNYSVSRVITPQTINKIQKELFPSTCKLDIEFEQIAKEILSLPRLSKNKIERIRVEKWIYLLRQVNASAVREYKKNRNLYIKYLRYQLLRLGPLETPFHTAPKFGSLPRLPETWARFTTTCNTKEEEKKLNEINSSLKESLIGEHESDATSMNQKLIKKISDLENILKIEQTDRKIVERKLIAAILMQHQVLELLTNKKPLAQQE
ncbi:hypothetical protein ABK040_008241 [Willaertia magna]